MNYLLRSPGKHRCICGWEGNPQLDKKYPKKPAMCPKCSEETTLISLREIPGYCFCCAGTQGKLLIVDHTMIRECRQCGARLNLHTVTPWIWEVAEMEQAINKLKTEMNGLPANAYLQNVGNRLLKILETNPTAAEKIMVEGKSIKGSYDAMEIEAKKKAVGGGAMFTPDESETLILKYFGIVGNAAPIQTTTNTQPVTIVPTQPKTQGRFDVSLDDLL